MNAQPTPRVYYATAIALWVLLAATVIAARLPTGAFAPVIALGIATVKAGLVVLFFMHLRYSSPVQRVFAGAALVWLFILFSITLADYFTRA